jgi:hypothetical protein
LLLLACRLAWLAFYPTAVVLELFVVKNSHTN